MKTSECMLVQRQNMKAYIIQIIPQNRAQLPANRDHDFFLYNTNPDYSEPPCPKNTKYSLLDCLF